MIRITKLSRNQIADFAKDPQQIKYFEALQTNVSELPDAIAILTAAVAEAQADADIATVSANEAFTRANQTGPDDFLPEMVMQPIGGGDAISAATVGATTKATPVDADLIPLIDSAAGYTLKNLTWANLKATLKTYFDSVVTTLTNKTINLSSNTLVATSAQLAAALTDETGTGLAVFGTNPTLTTPKATTTIGVGNATPSASGSGITFPATQSDSTDANTLDDYEEGTFTPTIVGSTAAGVGTYSQQLGIYTKIGRQVHFNVALAWSAHTGTGNMSIAGLPFTSVTAAFFIPCSNYIDGLTLPAGTVLQTLVVQSGTSINLFSIGTGGGAAAALAIDTAVTNLIVAGSYFT